MLLINHTAMPEVYTLSLHDALPIFGPLSRCSFVFNSSVFSGQTKRIPTHGLHYVFAKHALVARNNITNGVVTHVTHMQSTARSEEHTSELQSRPHLVCRLLLEKKKN